MPTGSVDSYPPRAGSINFRRDGLAFAAGLGLVGLGTLAYGALIESNRLTLERRKLTLPGWPKKLDGVTLAVLADLHIRSEHTAALGARAVRLAMEQEPDYIVIPGDIVAYWKPGVLEMVESVLTPLVERAKTVIISMGNHEYDGGPVAPMLALFERMGFTVLRNSSLSLGGIVWIGADSANARRDDVRAAFQHARGQRGPKVVLWHEPDLVEKVPETAALMISGHSHGGQFTFPGGFTPMHTENGAKYVRGFYPKARVPLYVSRGVGTTGPPSRLNCPPEVSLLTLTSG